MAVISLLHLLSGRSEGVGKKIKIRNHIFLCVLTLNPNPLCSTPTNPPPPATPLSPTCCCAAVCFTSLLVHGSMHGKAYLPHP